MNRMCFGLVVLLLMVASSPAMNHVEMGQTPLMGWNSWNYHGKRRINEQVVLETIDAMVDHGLRDAGYHYVVIDGGWRDKKLGPEGQLVPHPTKFPNGIKFLAAYAHSRGLKLGLHTVPGSHDCGGDAVGGFGHEEVQMRQFAEWGVDFLKIDKCGLRQGWDEALLKATYEKWANLIVQCDRDIALSISAYKWRDWYPNVCQMARTTLDIHCRIHKGGAVFDNATPYSVMSIATKNNEAAGFAGSGYWNDPDMIITGDHGLNHEEQKSHFALWCVMSAPLILGNDPRNMTPPEKEIVLNADCIAIDQDPTEQGRRLKVDGDMEIWAKKMGHGRVAVLLLNRSGEKTVPLTLDGTDLGLSGPIQVKDVYGKRDLGIIDSPIIRSTPPHGCQLFILSPNSLSKRVIKTSPNIVLILADDLGFGDLGCYGATRVKTPRIDHLAAEGLRLTEAYAPSSTCTPTRYSIMTGEYAWRQLPKKTSILDGDSPLCIESGRFTLPDMLRRCGYKTGVVGKWHLGLGDGVTRVDFNAAIQPGPLEVGFDTAYIIPATVDRVPSVWIKDHRVDGLDPSDPIAVSYAENMGDEPTGIERPDLLKQPADTQHACTIINGISRIGYMRGGHAARFKDELLADTVVDKSVAFIEQNKERPFFLCVGLFEPHVPRTPHPRFVGSSDCGVRGDVIHQIDWQTGQILDALERCDLTDNTLFLLTSDNGPVLFDGYFDRSVEEANGHEPAGPLRGWKYLVYEGGTRVPFIARWPGHIPVGQTDSMFCLTDLFATVADLCGFRVPSGAGCDSLNQLPGLLGRTRQPVRTSLVQHGISGSFALRQGDWKYMPANAKDRPKDMGSGANPNDTRFAAAIITQPLLFNLKEDPGEAANLAKKMPERVAAMQTLFDSIRKGKQAITP